MEEILKNVKILIEENCYIETDDVTMDTIFIDLGLDDLDMVDLIMNVVDFYNIEFSDEEYDSLRVVSELCKLIYDKTKKDFWKKSFSLIYLHLISLG